MCKTPTTWLSTQQHFLPVWRGRAALEPSMKSLSDLGSARSLSRFESTECGKHFLGCFQPHWGAAQWGGPAGNGFLLWTLASVLVSGLNTAKEDIS